MSGQGKECAGSVSYPRLTDSGAPSYLCPFQESWGAPYLARFSRDVGDPESPRNVSIWLQSTQVESSGIPHLAKNERDVGHPTLCGWDRPRGRMSGQRGTSVFVLVLAEDGYAGAGADAGGSGFQHGA